MFVQVSHICFISMPFIVTTGVLCGGKGKILLLRGLATGRNQNFCWMLDPLEVLPRHFRE